MQMMYAIEEKLDMEKRNNDEIAKVRICYFWLVSTIKEPSELKPLCSYNPTSMVTDNKWQV